MSDYYNTTDIYRDICTYKGTLDHVHGVFEFHLHHAMSDVGDRIMKDLNSDVI